jgi:hypothetical protein
VTISAKAGTGIWVVAREIHRLLTGSSGYGAQEQASIRAIAKEIAGHGVYGAAGSLKESESYRGGFYFGKNTVISLDSACLSEIRAVRNEKVRMMQARAVRKAEHGISAPRHGLAA